MQLLSVFLCCLVWLSAATATSKSYHHEPHCDCRGTKDGGPKSKQYICRDYRLGPVVLPRRLPLVDLVDDYDRFDGLTPGKFLKKWTNKKDEYVYPEQNGFQLDIHGNAINGSMILEPGTLVDRFGSEHGLFVSAAEAPYSQRALPPYNLDTDPLAPEYPYGYHVYRVIKALTVVGGPIRPWFGQPGLGAQFYIGDVGNILDLIDKGFLKRENPKILIKKHRSCA
ncbi:hypothetical protein BGZ63DRAFT_455274 [Mariannaea sp. PMI_226]|nr:hypothetical protein BGZ63DRAFT_455274 [Mariannaea sp. PMI_226]